MSCLILFLEIRTWWHCAFPCAIKVGWDQVKPRFRCSRRCGCTTEEQSTFGMGRGGGEKRERERARERKAVSFSSPLFSLFLSLSLPLLSFWAVNPTWQVATTMVAAWAIRARKSQGGHGRFWLPANFFSWSYIILRILIFAVESNQMKILILSLKGYRLLSMPGESIGIRVSIWMLVHICS